MIELTPRLERLGFTKTILHRLEAMKDESEYWQKAYSFIRDISTAKFPLSVRQHNWLVEICDRLKKPWE